MRRSLPQMNHKRQRAAHFQRSCGYCADRSPIEPQVIFVCSLVRRHCHLKDFTTIIPQWRLLYPIPASKSADDPNRRFASEPGKRAPKVLEALRRSLVSRLPVMHNRTTSGVRRRHVTSLHTIPFHTRSQAATEASRSTRALFSLVRGPSRAKALARRRLHHVNKFLRAAERPRS